MFMIEVVCLSWFFCLSPPPHQDRYPTRAACELALIDFARAWRPMFGAYRFNCRPVPKEIAL